jgi:Ca2+-binding EF-hand superfamily protein
MCHKAAPNRFGKGSKSKEEKEWAKGVFKSLPQVGPVRLADTPLARLTAGLSQPKIVVKPLAEETGKSNWDRRRAADEKAAAMAAAADRRSPSRERDASKVRPPSKAVSTFSGLSRHASKHHGAASDVADLAHRWHFPLCTTAEASKLFSKYAALPQHEPDEDMLRDGALDKEAMGNLVAELRDSTPLDELSATTEEIMGIVDKNQDGTVGFHEFAEWYHERQFLEYMNLTKEEINTRRVGKSLGLDVADMDFYKRQFDRYDTDKSGFIDREEFKGLLHALMKVPADLQIPDSRVHHFWQECDTDGSGAVDLPEFCSFYVKHFDPNAFHPMEDFYRGMRRVTKT